VFVKLLLLQMEWTATNYRVTQIAIGHALWCQGWCSRCLAVATRRHCHYCWYTRQHFTIFIL